MRVSDLPAWYDGLDENTKRNVWYNLYGMFMENKLLKGCVITGAIGLSFYTVHKIKEAVKRKKNKNVIDV